MANEILKDQEVERFDSPNVHENEKATLYEKCESVAAHHKSRWSSLPVLAHLGSLVRKPTMLKPVFVWPIVWK